MDEDFVLLKPVNSPGITPASAQQNIKAKVKAKPRKCCRTAIAQNDA